MDQARSTWVKNFLSEAVSLAGRWFAPHGGGAATEDAVSIHALSLTANRISVSVKTAPDRWLCKSPPLGISLRKASRRPGSLRIESRYWATSAALEDSCFTRFADSSLKTTTGA